MNILFVHQNYPGQFRESLPRLAASGKHRIVFLTQRKIDKAPKDHAVAVYKPDREPKADSYRFTRWFETNCANGIGAMKACVELKKRGFVPDLVVGHIGWGETMFIHDVFPNAPLAGYFEYYFIPEGGCVSYDPEFPETPDVATLLHARNAMNYLSLVRCKTGFTATEWQKQTYPALFHDKIEVLHEGIRTDRLVPDHLSPLEVSIGETTFRRGEEIVTYIARNLEPIRGVHTMLRALPALQQARPNARVVVIGGDDVSYGRKLDGGQTFRGRLTAELGDKVDWSRVHFVGQIPYGALMTLLKIAGAHVYLTAPFVISWSMLEAMALEKVVIAADVAPVRHFISHGNTGLLVDFFKPGALAETIGDVLARPAAYRDIGAAARRAIVAGYDFNDVCYPQFARYLDRAAGGQGLITV